MKLFTAGLPRLAIFAAYISAAALPKGPTSEIVQHSGSATEPTLDPQVMASLSTWFGWQLAGGAKDSNDITEDCSNISSIGADKWKEIGLVPANIRSPLCNASDGNPDPQTAFPNGIPAISSIIERQLIGSFSDKQDFEYLCHNLASFPIDQFFLTDSSLLKAVCDKADKQVPPRPFGSGAGRRISEAAGNAARNTASILYATLLASGAISDGRINIMCAHAPEYTANLNAEQLNGTLVKSTLCSFTGLLEVSQAQARILTLTSRLFITVLENIGRDEHWLGWLCEHLYVKGMNGVGLIGWGSRQQVCEDAKIASPIGNGTSAYARGC